jgi:hypothetical protein
MERLSAMAMEGERREKKDAATMTPAAKPSIASKMLLLTVLKKNTKLAPKRVTPQVKVVAMSAHTGGGRCTYQSSIVFLLINDVPLIL